MTLSPRIRADFLLLYGTPNGRQCLEAFATSEGVMSYKKFPNLVAKASAKMPELAMLIESLPPELLAVRVCMHLDGIEVQANQIELPTDALGGE
jgi:hypothetical protein